MRSDKVVSSIPAALPEFDDAKSARKGRPNIPGLDPLLQSDNVEVEPELLVEPENLNVTDEQSTRRAILKNRLKHYGNRVLASAQHLFIVLRDTVTHIATALAGSILLLPVVVIVRGTYVLTRSIFAYGKDIVLSLLRAIFEVLVVPVQAIYKVFYAFNKQVLFPLLKRIREDDTFAVIAFLMLVGVAIAVFVLVKQITF